MAQFLGVGYVEIAKAALIPALLYYLPWASWSIWEAKRLGLKAFPRNACRAHGSYCARAAICSFPFSCSSICLFRAIRRSNLAYYCILATVIISLVANNWKAWAGAGSSGMKVGHALAQCNRQAGKDILQAMENGGRLALAWPRPAPARALSSAW